LNCDDLRCQPFKRSSDTSDRMWHLQPNNGAAPRTVCPSVTSMTDRWPGRVDSPTLPGSLKPPTTFVLHHSVDSRSRRTSLTLEDRMERLTPAANSSNCEPSPNTIL